jgi:hypothetical protein
MFAEEVNSKIQIGDANLAQQSVQHALVLPFAVLALQDSASMALIALLLYLNFKKLLLQ